MPDLWNIGIRDLCLIHRFGTYKTLASTLESDMLENLKFIWNHSRKTIKKKKKCQRKMTWNRIRYHYNVAIAFSGVNGELVPRFLTSVDSWPLIKSALTLLAKCMHVMNKWWRGHTCGAQILCLFLVSFIPTMISFQWIQTF